jgi:hypothetical protein
VKYLARSRFVRNAKDFETVFNTSSVYLWALWACFD